MTGSIDRTLTPGDRWSEAALMSEWLHIFYLCAGKINRCPLFLFTPLLLICAHMFLPQSIAMGAFLLL
jgi:hypothetical protein